MAGFSTLMVLIPEARAGFYVVNHREGSALRDNLKHAILQRFFPASRESSGSQVAGPGEGEGRAVCRRVRIASVVLELHPARIWGRLNVVANPDGTLGFAAAAGSRRCASLRSRERLRAHRVPRG